MTARDIAAASDSEEGKPRCTVRATRAEAARVDERIVIAAHAHEFRASWFVTCRLDRTHQNPFIASQTLPETSTVSSHIALPGSKLQNSAALLLSLLVTACAQTTRGSTTTSSGDYRGAPAASIAADASRMHTEGMMVRISEIQIEPSRLDEYKAILKEEAEASVRLEPGVISIFPMYERENPTEVRILEIYASRAAYQSHLGTPHFQKYKTTTLPMVRSLRLVDMEAMDPATMTTIFGKMQGGR